MNLKGNSGSGTSVPVSPDAESAVVCCRFSARLLGRGPRFRELGFAGPHPITLSLLQPWAWVARELSLRHPQTPPACPQALGSEAPLGVYWGRHCGGPSAQAGRCPPSGPRPQYSSPCHLPPPWPLHPHPRPAPRQGFRPGYPMAAPRPHRSATQGALCKPCRSCSRLVSRGRAWPWTLRTCHWPPSRTSCAPSCTKR